MCVVLSPSITVTFYHEGSTVVSSEAVFFAMDYVFIGKVCAETMLRKKKKKKGERRKYTVYVCILKRDISSKGKNSSGVFLDSSA